MLAHCDQTLNRWKVFIENTQRSAWQIKHTENLPSAIAVHLHCLSVCRTYDKSTCSLSDCHAKVLQVCDRVTGWYSLVICQVAFGFFELISISSNRIRSVFQRSKIRLSDRADGFETLLDLLLDYFHRIMRSWLYAHWPPMANGR